MSLKRKLTLSWCLTLFSTIALSVWATYFSWIDKYYRLFILWIVFWTVQILLSIFHKTIEEEWYEQEKNNHAAVRRKEWYMSELEGACLYWATEAIKKWDLDEAKKLSDLKNSFLK